VLGSRRSLSEVKAGASAMADEEHADKREEVSEVRGCTSYFFACCNP
jgi:hypothetical protein